MSASSPFEVSLRVWSCNRVNFFLEGTASIFLLCKIWLQNLEELFEPKLQTQNEASVA